MRAVAQAVRPEDRHLVALDRIALAEIDLRLHDAIDRHSRAAACAAFLAADPGDRGAGEFEGGGGAGYVADERVPFAPDARVARIPAAREGDRRIVFLEAP